MAKARKHTPEQIVNILASDRSGSGERKDAPGGEPGGRNHGADLPPLAQGVWRLEGGPGKRLKELEQENGKLKRLVAELSLDKQILQDIARGNF